MHLALRPKSHPSPPLLFQRRFFNSSVGDLLRLPERDYNVPALDTYIYSSIHSLADLRETLRLLYLRTAVGRYSKIKYALLADGMLALNAHRLRRTDRVIGSISLRSNYIYTQRT